MNNGKICVSVCADTVEALTKQVRQIEESADVVEIRFDCLNEVELGGSYVENLRSSLYKLFGSGHRKPILSTFRPKEQGGKKALSLEERQTFWSMGFDREWADLEEDIIKDSVDQLWEKRICSFHDFSGIPLDLESIYDRLAETHADIIKIAIRAEDIIDSLPIWRLLKRGKNQGRSIIPIAMGEAGKWTRILGLAHGAFMTYAALETGGETAPGQISVRDMGEVYRVKELNENTNVYGIIAGNTSYSISPWMHNAAFKSAGLNSVFVPLQVADIDVFFKRMVLPATREIDLNFKGFSVTNPHKQAIIPYLDEIDKTAAKIGAVNTVKIENGKLHGYNTDAHGFIETLKNTYGDLKDARVAVFGAGGASRACIFTLQQEGALVTLIARNEETGQPLADEFKIEYGKPPADRQPLAADFDIIINTTPLGTAGPSGNFAILETPQVEGIKLVYDLVYNPAETVLMREAKAAGVPSIGGIEMLIAQGAKQFEIWTGSTAPIDAMRSAVQKRLRI